MTIEDPAPTLERSSAPTRLLRFARNDNRGSPLDLTQDQAWRELADELRPFIARRVRSDADVDDILQDTFLRIQRGLPSLRDEQRFIPWIYRVARSAVIDHIRSAMRHPVARLEPSDVADEPDDADDGGAELELAGCAARFVATLPSSYREALTLTELEGLTQAQAAQMLGISVSGMKSRVQRGREKLRAVLERCCEVSLDARGRVAEFEPRRDGGSATCGGSRDARCG